jgi:lysophospholipase L1-like esterase
MRRHLVICALAAVLSAPAAAAAHPVWRAAWAAAANTPASISQWLQHPAIDGAPTAPEVTYRLIVRPTIAGTAVRLRLTNDGSQPLEIGAATIGQRQPAVGLDGTVTGSSVVPGTMHPVTFGGKPAVSVPAGGELRTDPIPMAVHAFEDLAVSLYVPTSTTPTWHSQSYVTQYVTPPQAGDLTGTSDGSEFAIQQEPIPWLDAVEVLTSAPRAIVALGDSITDGDQAGTIDDRLMNQYAPYPYVLAQRIHGTRGVQRAAVVNEGINGDSANGILARIKHDVFDLSGVTDVILEIGTNDIFGGQSADTVIANITKIARMLHARGLHVAGATLVPREGTSNAAAIAAVDQFIRTSPLFDDGVLDIHRVVSQDDSDNWQLGYDSGDFTHPTIAGYAAIADSFPLGFLRHS